MPDIEPRPMLRPSSTVPLTLGQLLLVVPEAWTRERRSLPQALTRGRYPEYTPGPESKSASGIRHPPFKPGMPTTYSRPRQRAGRPPFRRCLRPIVTFDLRPRSYVHPNIPRHRTSCYSGLCACSVVQSLSVGASLHLRRAGRPELLVHSTPAYLHPFSYPAQSPRLDSVRQEPTKTWFPRTVNRELRIPSRKRRLRPAAGSGVRPSMLATQRALADVSGMIMMSDDRQPSKRERGRRRISSSRHPRIDIMPAAAACRDFA